MAVAAAALLEGTSVLAAVQPGLYFDVGASIPGQPVILFSAADYVVCWSQGSEENVLVDRPVYLAPASVKVTTPADRALVAVAGVWSEHDGALFFKFHTPQVPSGDYLAWIECSEARLDVSTVPLQVRASAPATDANTLTAKPDSGWRVAIPALLGFIVLVAIVNPSRKGPRWWSRQRHSRTAQRATPRARH
jgi:hypothetical protein